MWLPQNFNVLVLRSLPSIAETSCMDACMTKTLDPDFPLSNEDAPFLSQLDSTVVRPVFIMGLHRSGTTFLYSCMAKSFPLANLSLYHLFYYDRLLANKSDDGCENKDKALLNNYLLSLGVGDRGLDSTEVNADSVEEYGFLLRQRFSSFKFSDKNAPFFDQMCRKLLYVQKGSEAVLLKNPWDTGNAETILKHFPQARFVYINREPIAVLNSMLNAMLSYLESPQHYLELLLSPSGNRQSYRGAYVLWRGLRLVRKLIGRNAMARLLRPVMRKNLAVQLAGYRAEIDNLPKDKAVEVDYQQLVADPQAVMANLQPLLSLPLLNADLTMNVRQRFSLNPILQGYESKLMSYLKTRGVL
ncbi:Sulfotransferase family [Spongiibacter sp. IMCC21906]|nr:Sulfotransferase family [Spongiibacter sp. IMCC21906]